MATMNFLGLESLASLFRSSAAALKRSDASPYSDTSLYLAQGSAWGDMTDPRASYFDDWLQAGTVSTNTVSPSAFTGDDVTSNVTSALDSHPGPNADGFVAPSVMLNSITDAWLPDSSPGKTPDSLTNGADTSGLIPATTPPGVHLNDGSTSDTNLHTTSLTSFDVEIYGNRSDFNATNHGGFNPLLSPAYVGYESTTLPQTINPSGALINFAATPN